MTLNLLKTQDPAVYRLIQQEERRQREKISLIASENFFSPAVREAVGSVFSHKYSEGNIGQRYYEGNENVDELEKLTIDRACRAFRVPADWTANVQALSGSNANLAVYLALLNEGDTIMSMYLPDGGHLSHGWSYEPDKAKRQQDLESNNPVYLGGSRRVHLTARLYQVVQYKTDPKTKMLDYDQVAQIARQYQPRLIITGGTAYPRNIDYTNMKQIARQVGAYYLADIAHEAGLIVGEAAPSPVGIADVVTMTTHKTLRSGRGAIILSQRELMNKINRGVLPGLQGGPHNHNIAGIAVGLGQALQPEFVSYANQVVKNAKQLATSLTDNGFTVVTGGTDKHLVLLDLNDESLSGKYFARALDRAGIVTNATTLPWDSSSPRDPAGLRVGTPWITTRGMGKAEIIVIAALMRQVMTICADLAALPWSAFNKQLSNKNGVKAIAHQIRQSYLNYQLSAPKVSAPKVANT